MAKKIPQSFLDQLINRVDIIDVIGSRIKLKKSGHNYHAKCPFHNENTPSFSASQKKQFYYCFGCGAHGNSISFIMEYDKLDFKTTVETLAASVNLEVPVTDDNSPSTKPDYEVMETAAKLFYQQLRKSSDAINYLKQRGLTGETTKQFQIGFAPPGWHLMTKSFAPNQTQQLLKNGLILRNDKGSHYDRFRDRIMFPIRDIRGRVIAFGGRCLDQSTPKYLNSPETALFQKKRQLYGLYEAKQASTKLDHLIFVEGYMDVVSLHQHGITTAIATLGTATSTEHLQLAFRHTSKIIFCFDGDRAGRDAAWRALKNALPIMRDGLEAQFIFLPEKQDPDSMIKQYGKEAFQQLIDHADSLSDIFFQHINTNINIDKMDGRAKLAHEALTLLEQIPQGIFKQLMLDKLANTINVDAKQFDQQTPVYKKPAETKPSTLSPMKRCLSILIQHPNLANEIDNHQTQELETITLKGTSLLNKLIQLIQNSDTPQNTGILLTYFDDEQKQYLSKLATLEYLIPEKGLKSELNGAITRLIITNRQVIINQLLIKAGNNQLTDTEKHQLQQLISQQKVK